MKIKNITLNNFRVFKNQTTITFNKNLAAISGINGVGKSTILAALVNSCELKTPQFKPFIGSSFSAHFEQLITYDETFDTRGTDKVKIKFSDFSKNNSDLPSSGVISFRASIQTARDKTFKRYRLIPSKIKGIREHEAKVQWPVLYLGLSRLLPIGESDVVETKKINPEISQKVAKIHKQIMFETFDLDKTTTEFLQPDTYNDKKFAGLSTESYSSTSNSSGQDNLTSILLAIESFYSLKEHLKTDYDGGLLAIDELDATLHPAVQISLFKYLKKVSLDLDLQIFFTTHSISLLEYISTDESSNIIFIDRQPSEPTKLEIIDNPNTEFFKNNLSRTISKSVQKSEKIRVLTEDAVARDFIEKIISKSNSNELKELVLLDVNMSWTSILNLVNSDYTYFSKIITILDPDADKFVEKNRTTNDGRLYSTIIDNPNLSSILKLPGDSAIEKMVWTFIEASEGSLFWDSPNLRNSGITYGTITGPEYSPKFKYPKEDRDKEETKVYKTWHTEHPEIYSIFLDLWIDEHRDIVGHFGNNLLYLKRDIEKKIRK